MTSNREESLLRVSQIQNLLDRQDIFSLVFLLFDNADHALQVLHLHDHKKLSSCDHWPVLDSSIIRPGNHSVCRGGLLVEWVISSHSSGWKNILIEALLIIKNYQCYKVLGVESKEHDKIDYLAHICNMSVAVNPVRKLLYMMVDDMSASEWAKLLTLLVLDLSVMQRDPPCISRETPAEYFLLFLLSRGLLRTKGENRPMDFQSLTKNLEKIGIHSWANRIREFEDRVNEKGTKHVSEQKLEDMDRFNLYPSNPGFILIINQKTFNNMKDDSGIPLEDRDGSDRDAHKLERTFKLLNFNVKIVDNCSAERMRKHIEASVKEFSALKKVKNMERCFAVAILSHGDESGVYGVDGRILSIDVVLDLLRNVALIGVPRLAFIQACKGYSQVMKVNGIPMRINTDQASNLSDLLLFSSSVKGFTAYRSCVLGSFFIHALCVVILKHGSHEDFVHCAKKVAQRLKNLEIRLEGGQTVTMTPEIQTTFSKELYLTVCEDKREEAQKLVEMWEREFGETQNSMQKYHNREKHDVSHKDLDSEQRKFNKSEQLHAPNDFQSLFESIRQELCLENESSTS